MTTDTTTPGYSHTQTAPLCLLLYATAVILLVVGLAVLLPGMGLVAARRRTNRAGVRA